MLIKQISVFLENTKGRLSFVTKVLADNNIDIRALSVADTTDFGIMRLIVSDPDRAFKALHDSGFTVSQTEVLGARINDKPGALADMLDILVSHEMSVEYIYVFVAKNNRDAFVIMKINDEGAPKAAVELLKENGVSILNGEDINNI